MIFFRGMEQRSFFSPLLLSTAVIAGGIAEPGQAAESIALPPPRLDAGLPLMQTLQARRSTREFLDKDLPQQLLADLLWAAFGVNRPAEHMRTAPTAHNRQEIDIYVAKRDGLFRYDATHHALQSVLQKDIRALTGRQDFPAHAALNLVYVADLSRAKDVPRDAALEVGAIATGAIVQNVYLFCASAGLATVVRGWIDKKALAKAMGLRSDQYIFVAQTVGYPRP
jgi:SagB-type dehydrogenase family enzyme